MKRLAVQVESYAGSRADQHPRRIMIEGRQYRVARLLSSSVEQSLATSALLRRFRVVTDEGLQLDLIHTSDGDWFLERQAESATTDEHG